ncbi:hypothetical protein [Paraliomyxa miuraensis]|uniref:hypothetical protein n=1 Tax=Paraliomyxa miuraensis TaxID=376150 RepID=UPI00224EB932|nr:hypothetical protein [Paraliomyxa miuraensis]MCX4247195.1 hypothetical protein [Paraliomyxa miuraensis]
MLLDLRVLAVALVLTSCGRAKDTATVEPEPASAPEPEAEPEEPFETQTFVSTSRNDEGPVIGRAEEEEASRVVEGFTITTREAVKDAADGAVADRLDPKKSWKQSPILPASWPSTEPAVIVYFYPMAANPGSLTQFKLLSPKYRVTVSLVDGTTTVDDLGKGRVLGTIEESRPSSLERRELEISETLLIDGLVGIDSRSAENPYWGYLKYVHEHPKFGRDLEKRAASFFGWVHKKTGK